MVHHDQVGQDPKAINLYSWLICIVKNYIQNFYYWETEWWRYNGHNLEWYVATLPNKYALGNLLENSRFADQRETLK